LLLFPYQGRLSLPHRRCRAQGGVARGLHRIAIASADDVVDLWLQSADARAGTSAVGRSADPPAAWWASLLVTQTGCSLESWVASVRTTTYRSSLLRLDPKHLDDRPPFFGLRGYNYSMGARISRPAATPTRTLPSSTTKTPFTRTYRIPNEWSAGSV